jgi:glycosyltransferase involved in cell wall biosynthesis
MARNLPKMLYVGDFPAPTGFGIVSRNLISTFRKHYDMHIIGVNYFGDYDPHIEGLKVYPASAGGGEIYGFDKFFKLLMQITPDVCFVLNDVWIAMDYNKHIAEYKKNFPDNKTVFVLYTPIDAENIKKDFVDRIDNFDHVVTYTEFGKRQLLLSGIEQPVHVVPHGVDLAKFKRLDKKSVKSAMKIGADSFVVLNVSRNQPRKRLDMFFYIFAEWVRRYDIPDTVRCYYHGALQDYGIDIIQWCDYLGIKDRLAISRPDLTPDNGLTDEQMNMVYNCADVFFTTTAAEGWGLPIAEAMAVGVPCIIPNHSALAEWPDGNALYTECYPFPSLTDRGLNTIHHLTEVESAIQALHKLYTDSQFRKELGDASYKHMQNPKFNWERIAKQFMEIIKNGKTGD